MSSAAKLITGCECCSNSIDACSCQVPESVSVTIAGFPSHQFYCGRNANEVNGAWECGYVSCQTIGTVTTWYWSGGIATENCDCNLGYVSAIVDLHVGAQYSYDSSTQNGRWIAGGSTECTQTSSWPGCADPSKLGSYNGAGQFTVRNGSEYSCPHSIDEDAATTTGSCSSAHLTA